MPSEKIDLPPMPASQMNVDVWDSEVRGLHGANAAYYTADQMTAYALLAVKQERELTRLWVVQKRKPGIDSPWSYDCHYGFVVRAADETRARTLASDAHGDEGGAVWMDAELTSCVPLTNDGAEEIILSDFLAG